MHLIIRSRNTSCYPLREIDTGSKRVIYRMGSTTPTRMITHRPVHLEINSTEACRVSGDKRLMKEAFVQYSSEHNVNIPTAEYINSGSVDDIVAFFNDYCTSHGAIIKRYNSSKGNGIYMINSVEELHTWLSQHRDIINYVVEKYYNYSKEYRLHVSNEGCFYTCRKMLKEDAEDRWHRHESNSVWILEDNQMFAKPSNWDEIVTACINAKNAVGLDIAAVDIKTTTWMRDPCKFIILETNSAPSLGDIGIQKYINFLTNYINE